VKKLLLPFAAAAVAMASPAAAALTVTSQVAMISLGNLDNSAISAALINFADFNSFALTGQHLTKVTLKVNSSINGAVRATNNTGSFRDPSASYTLDTSATGMGFSLSGSETETETYFNVPTGGFRVISAIDPTVLMTQSLTSGLSVFNAGPVQISFDASALLATMPIDVLFGNGVITNNGSLAMFTLEYESVIPEPATWALMIVGFGMVGVAARRRKAAVAA
jgi:PEP-CTERM motif